MGGCSLIGMVHDRAAQVAALWFAFPVLLSTVWQLVGDMPPDYLPWAASLLAWVIMLVMIVWISRQGEIDETKVYRASFAVAFTALALLPPVLLDPGPAPLYVSVCLAFVGGAQVLVAWIAGSLRRFDISALISGLLAVSVGAVAMLQNLDEAFLGLVLLFIYGFGMIWGMNCWRAYLFRP